MTPNGYAYQLRTLRALERQRNVQYTDQAMTVYNMRIATIDASDVSEERKIALREAASRQWTVFMERDFSDFPF